MIVKLLTEHHLECLSLKRGCRGSSESTLVKRSNCCKTRAAAFIILLYCPQLLVSNQMEEYVYLVYKDLNIVHIPGCGRVDESEM